jgi:hypothetical protein
MLPDAPPPVFGVGGEQWSPSDISPFGTLVGSWSTGEFSSTETRGFYNGPNGTAKIIPKMETWITSMRG